MSNFVEWKQISRDLDGEGQLTGSLSVSGSLSVEGPVNVTGSTTITDTLDLGNKLTIDSGGIEATGSVLIEGDLIVDGIISTENEIEFGNVSADVIQANNSLTVSGVPVQELGAVDTVFYVSKDGNDLNSGKTLETSFRTIKEAAQAAQVFVGLAQSNIKVDLTAYDGYVNFSDAEDLESARETLVNGVIDYMVATYNGYEEGTEKRSKTERDLNSLIDSIIADLEGYYTGIVYTFTNFLFSRSGDTLTPVFGTNALGSEFIVSWEKLISLISETDTLELESDTETYISSIVTEGVIEVTQAVIDDNYVPYLNDVKGEKETPRVGIEVRSGFYEEVAPITLPNRCSINGDDLRTVLVSPTKETKGENLFHLNNGTYVSGLRLTGCEIDNLENPKKGFFFAFAPLAYITTSPYIQNCTSVFTPFEKFYAPLDPTNDNPDVGEGPGGLIVDSAVLHPYSPLKSMVLDAYTQVAFNGIGICLREKGFCQLVSFFTNFSKVGVYAIDGGHGALLNSNTTFGDYGLRAKGERQLVIPDVSNIPATIDTNASVLIKNSKSTIIDNMWNAFISEDSPSGTDYTTEDQVGVLQRSLEQATKTDSGLLVDAIADDLRTSVQGSRITQFVTGHFRSDALPALRPYLLPDYFKTYDLLETEIKTVLTGRADAITKVEEMFATIKDTLDTLVNNIKVDNSIFPVDSYTSEDYATMLEQQKTAIVEYTRDEFFDNIKPTSHENLYELVYNEEGEYINNIVQYDSIDYYTQEFKDKTERDLGYLLDAIIYDLRNGNTDQTAFERSIYFLQSLFTGEGKPVFDEFFAYDYVQCYQILFNGIIYGEALNDNTVGGVELTSGVKTDSRNKIIGILGLLIQHIVQLTKLIKPNFETSIISAKAEQQEIDKFFEETNNVKQYISIVNDAFNNFIDDEDSLGEDYSVNLTIEFKTKRDMARIMDAVIKDLQTTSAAAVPNFLTFFFREGSTNQLIGTRTFGKLIEPISVPVENEEDQPADANPVNIFEALGEGKTRFNTDKIVEYVRSWEYLRDSIFVNIPDLPINIQNKIKHLFDEGLITTALAVCNLPRGEQDVDEPSYYTVEYINNEENTVSEQVNVFDYVTDRGLREVTQRKYLNPDLFIIPGDDNNTPRRLIEVFGSLITSTAHDFSYAGSGVNFLGLPINQGGVGTSNLDLRVIQEDGGRVFYNAGDEEGDFYIGDDLIIRLATGTIEGRTFRRSILSIVTPFSLAIEQLN